MRASQYGMQEQAMKKKRPSIEIVKRKRDGVDPAPEEKCKAVIDSWKSSGRATVERFAAYI
ncbi:hypothetical protein WAI453_004648 [Rhynchosporium graminicola]